ncbi:hypothetical protein Dfer_1949 [Dyadobacter fermentans DSM 18053]|uniref:Uncharacterized protein n=1 Tax=Dyadobacter fermentans (strain ATCC 700827 / DSM 18053 / CIP 107007 / KCTC 52180 / NS114) TaxID=471854 RepID=C6VW42_DYAFD|nr:hypothetical protein Dfer_1949 [Dyadobacter fermentans DSM 18053]
MQAQSNDVGQIVRYKKKAGNVSAASSKFINKTLTKVRHLIDG